MRTLSGLLVWDPTARDRRRRRRASTSSALIFGGLLMIGALASGLAHRSFLSLTAVFVLAGFLLGDGGFGVLEIDPRSELRRTTSRSSR